MDSVDKKLEDQLMELGNKLLNPPSSVDELLPLLDLVENCLSRVEQSPPDSMQSALAPSQKALIVDKLFRHTDIDVKVAVASCISEITRITAPDAPYDDDQMKDVFQLFISSFENLADESSRSYPKRTMILETVAKVRSCVVMLDLECDALIIEMFQLFLNSIRNYHPENVFSSMETIMVLVLEESEDISVELLSPLLACVKRANEEVLPIAQKLGEKVLKSCAAKIKPYLTHAVKSLGVSIDEYSSVVASICREETVINENNDSYVENANNVDGEIMVEESPDEKVVPANDDTCMPLVSNGVSQVDEDEKLVDSNSVENQEDKDHKDHKNHIDTSTNAEPQNLDAKTVVEADVKPEYAAKKKGRKIIISKRRVEPVESTEIDDAKSEKLTEDKSSVQDVLCSPHQESFAEADPENKETEAQPSLKKAVESESGIAVSPSWIENLPDESLSKKARQSKKEGLIKDSAPSSDDTPEKASSSENLPDESLSKKARQSNKGSLIKDSAPSSDDTPEKASLSENLPDESLSKKARQLKKESLIKDSAPSCDDTPEKASLSENLPDESLSKKARQLKKESLIKDSAPSCDDAPEKASEEASDSDAKPPKWSGKKGSSLASTDNKAQLLSDSSKETGTAGNSEEEPLKQLSKKVEVGSTNGDYSSLKQSKDKKHRKQAKPVSENEVVKSATKVDAKGKILSPKSSAKSIKDAHPVKETPKTVAKRKHEPSASKDYGEEVVGEKVKVWWPKDQQFYEGKIDSFDRKSKKHKIAYDDGDVEMLILKREKFEFIGSNSESEEEEPTTDGSADDASELLLKKVKTNLDQSKKPGKLDASQKQSVGTSSSKAKIASIKSVQKFNESSKIDGKSLDDSKASRASEDDVGFKSKDRNTKTGSESAAASKSSGKIKGDDLLSKTGKSKEDGIGTLKASKSKQETPKSTKIKQDALKSAHSSKREKLSPNDAKPKTGSSKGIAEEDEGNSIDLGEARETTKVKSTSSSKGQRSRVKGGKKVGAADAKLKSASKGIAEDENSTDSGEALETTKGKSTSLSKGKGRRVKSGKKSSGNDTKLKSGPAIDIAEEDAENSTDSDVAQEIKKVKFTSSSKGQRSQVKSGKKGNASNGKVESGPSKGKAEDAEPSTGSGEERETLKLKPTITSRGQGSLMKSGKKDNAIDGKSKSGSSKGTAEEEEEDSADSSEVQETAKLKSTSSPKRQESQVKSGKKRHRGA